jgi:hypothetical protein
VPNTDFSTPAPYSLPYRALYSKNVDNLFFAGRNISMTHTAMSSIRVMATCGLLGEAVGKAVSIAVKNDCAPHDVYLSHINKVQSLLMREDCFLPHVSRKVHSVCEKAVLLGANDFIRNGQDRIHTLYGNSENDKAFIEKGGKVCYTFDKAHIKGVRLVFDSDLNRNTISGGTCERHHSTRANVSLSAPMMSMPTTLCKEFSLSVTNASESETVLSVVNNRKRSYFVPIDKECDGITLTLHSSWGDEKIPLITFDFE